jgi:3-oxoacyl-(acyl-carrier-protein) synthase
MRAYNGQDNDRPDRASRPYARDRAGFVFSEGAGILVLESRESAESRSAPILGVLRGYGMTSDGAGEMVAPYPSVSAAVMRLVRRESDMMRRFNRNPRAEPDTGCCGWGHSERNRGLRNGRSR